MEKQNFNFHFHSTQFDFLTNIKVDNMLKLMISGGGKSRKSRKRSLILVISTFTVLSQWCNVLNLLLLLLVEKHAVSQ